jgi:hypothetical protein
MANIEVTEMKQVQVTSKNLTDILKSSTQVADVEESMGFQMVDMVFPPPQRGGGLIMYFQRSKGGGGGGGNDGGQDPTPEYPDAMPYPHPFAGMFGG